ncbi:MAG: 4Fe-4S dicluster domain-containing protein [Desulfobacterales bacterium]|nr:4Fe-4S dicluster domain-containing protein [Desulfobacterales bacterium]MBF0395670.1 4Fe-4S dicluster domain-containing protein [Desulfobacterales bacterium]
MEFWRKPLDADDIHITRGNVYVLDDRCKGCGYCIEFCPQKVLKASKGFNKKGYHYPEILKPKDCLNCHYCEIICPDFAIYSIAQVVAEKGSKNEVNK